MYDISVGLFVDLLAGNAATAENAIDTGDMFARIHRSCRRHVKSLLLRKASDLNTYLEASMKCCCCLKVK